MSGRLPEEKVFKDPVHNYIYVRDRVVWDLIDTPEFQRLRRIRQLGTSFFTFHGAEHSRFSHSLGVYEIARRMISQFERNGYAGWPREQSMVCLCAALLHDIGHGPFSHSIERVFGVRHEDWSCRIVTGETEVRRVLEAYDPGLPERVAAVISKTYPETIVVSLVASQLDADRMDYLLRDAYYTGVRYGTFDLERILRVLRPHGGLLVVKESGMHAVEDYLMSRYQMYWQVYFHPVTRSSEILLRHILLRYKELYEQGHPFAWLPEELCRLLEGTADVGDYLALDEAYMMTTFARWTKEQDAVLADLCRRFLNRRLFKYVAVEPEELALVDDVRAALADAGFHPDYYAAVDFPTDMPYDVYRPDAPEGSLPILILDDRDRTVEISHKSEIIRSISGIVRGRHRLYVPEEWLAMTASMPPRLRKLFERDAT
ncbi:MAG: hypothetical protein BLM47_03685 [Candidatus Reconcilbacillus cellulovorans]|uniref:HD domain-containing protein n=1 Tax=Candidatus Reconcilbacillus cellulovorans TaxID=1906605 RepID=A0A2A6E2V6_9BACL|nr:MAG: hypothetical protein BLM47_03685 [Candidatus Reconcilbacillus cellulovorans]